MMLRVASLLSLPLLALSACNASEGPQLRPSLTRVDAAPDEHPGLVFARAKCAGCHAVAAGISPNPQAPAFAAVINTPGLDLSTLNAWLRNSHDFPEMMQFEIQPAEVDNLARYMLTLKDPGYRPAL